MEDVFEGAVGIDLGTTYSYVFQPTSFFLRFLNCPSVAVLVSGKTTVSKSSPTTVSIPADFLRNRISSSSLRTEGNRTTPSYVAFSTEVRLIGDAAKNQAAMNPKNTVFDAKRLIGRRFEYVYHLNRWKSLC